MEIYLIFFILLYLLLFNVFAFIDLKKRVPLEFIILILAVVSFIICSVFYFQNTDIVVDRISSFGKTIAGIFAFFSVILLIVNIRKQSSSFLKNQFDNNFYKMIEYHRGNVNQMAHLSPETLRRETPILYEGNRVFLAIHKELIQSTEIIKKHIDNFDGISIYKTPDNIPQEFILRKTNLNRLALIDIAYTIVFFGVDRDGQQIAKDILQRTYNEGLIKDIIRQMENIPVKYSKYRKRSDVDVRNRVGKFNKFFGGHQSRLGHYYRHLYQSIKTIDENSDLSLSYEDKYKYIKKIRAQFSIYEQSIMFFNSISQMGRIWEFHQSEENKQLITKYNLIKNLHSKFFMYVDVHEFFPDITYEGDFEKSDNRISMERRYK